MALSAHQPRLEQLDSFVIEMVRDVCSTMLDLKVKPIGRAEVADKPVGKRSGMAGSVSFAGKNTGSICMPPSESLACKLFSQLDV